MSTVNNFQEMEFDRNWNNRSDFPTHELSEDQVRADMQYLFDSIQEQFNAFLKKLKADMLVFTPTAEVQASTIQSAIENVQAQVVTQQSILIGEGAVKEGNLDKDSVSTVKIQDDAVTEDKIADGAVTSDKLADGAITGEAIGEGEITGYHLAEDSVTAFQIADHSVGYDQLAENAVYGNRLKNGSVVTSKLENGAVTTDKILGLAVTTAKIANLAVETGKIANSAVTSDKIGSGEVKTANIGTGQVTYEKTTNIQKKHVIPTAITIEVADWDSDEMTCTVEVPGVSLTDVATQRVDWTPSGDSDWTNIGKYGIRALRVPPEDGKVTMKCDALPEESISLYFCIFD